MKDKDDNFKNDSQRKDEIDEFMNRFDEIKKSFESNENTNILQQKTQGEAGTTEQAMSPRRAERLERIRSKKSGQTEENMAKKNKKRKRYRLNLVRLLVVIICLGLLAVGSAGAWALKVIGNTPAIDADNIYSMLAENSIIYDDAGNELESLFYSGEGLRTNLNYTEIPEDLINAFIAIEDKTFWEHQGFNVIRIFGAIIDGLTSGDSIKGTSTITQQLARNLYLPDTKGVRSLERKVQEAYYAIQLEKQLSKEQIIEAYLNTIYLGSGANGVQAATQTYFSKDVNDLTIAECAVLASIPKHPNKNSPLKKLENEDIDNPDSLDFIYRGETFSIWYQDDFKDRQLLVLSFMKDQGKIDENQYEEAIAQDIRATINPDISASSEISSYFADYVINDVISGLMYEYDMDETEAKDMIYNGGLRIYSTINISMQKIIESEYTENNSFPSVNLKRLNKDGAGNARDSSGNILLYEYSNMFDENENFTLSPDEYSMNENGSMTVFKGNRLNIFKTEVNKNIDYSVEFKGIYTIEDNVFYTISNGYILIPSKFKSRDEEGNLIISKEFFEEGSPFTISESGVTIPKTHFQLNAKIIQPQSAMVIIDYKTGSIKAMAGGRGQSGKQLYNRATATRQPGSAIKPMAVYGPAIQRSSDMVKNNSLDSGLEVWTAASVIDDAPLIINGKLWPKNWYPGYRGLHTLRQSVEQSVNVNAVKVLTDIGTATSLSFLKKLGVTTVVESGNSNDMNAAALALGGMTNGISPLQMAAAYGTFANQGIYVKPSSFATVTNKRGEVLLQNDEKKEVVMDRETAFIMTDILRTTVTSGIAGSASIGSHTVAGKTGTTTDNYDAWFVGMTPHYAAAVWIGNDINLELTQGSVAAARLWSKIMKQVHKDLPAASFPKAENIVSAQIDTKSGKLPSELSSLDPRGTLRSEYFISGTVPKDEDDIHVAIDICSGSGYMATPYCSNVENKVMTRRPEGSITSHSGFTVGDMDYEAPHYYCNLHNPDPQAYPIDPEKELNPYTPPENGWNGGMPPWLDGTGSGSENENGNGTNDPGDYDPSADPDPPAGNSSKPEWLN